jgi:hypothetical protein
MPSKSGASPMPGASRAGSRSCPTAPRPRRFPLPSAGTCSRPSAGPRPSEGTVVLRVREPRITPTPWSPARRDIPDRSAAEALKGARMFVPRSSFPTAGTDEYYWVDLIGLDVVNREGVALGTVSELLATGPQTVLVLDGEGGGQTRGAHDPVSCPPMSTRWTWPDGASRWTGNPITEPCTAALACASTSLPCFPSCLARF